MVRLLGLARELGLGFVDLTSRPSREVANGLYRSLGFQLRDTNCYRHDLTELPSLR
jgi:ribosomal protein S18 acetylase RimI-like enzyme